MTSLETAIVAMLALCTFFLLAIWKGICDICLIAKDVADDIDLIRSAAEGIERNVGVIAQPMNSRKQKRFQRRLRLAWPHIIKTMEQVFSKGKRTPVTSDEAPHVFVKETTTIEHRQ